MKMMMEFLKDVSLYVFIALITYSGFRQIYLMIKDSLRSNNLLKNN